MSPTVEQLQSNLNAVASMARRSEANNARLESALRDLQRHMQGVSNETLPKWIEDLPGARAPYFAVIDVTFSANSTAAQESTHHLSLAGPFVCTGVALFFKKTSGAYQSIWGPATAFDARISSVSQQHGFANLLDQPHCSSFTVEISAHGSDRFWQSDPVSSALYSPQAGGAYVLPASHLFPEGSTIKLRLTPDVSMTYSAAVQGVFLGYKVLQGLVHQP